MIWILKPNSITTIRIATILAGSIMLVFPPLFVPAMTLIIVGSLTDKLDGYIAKKYGLGSDFGKVYDQVSDKISAVFIMSAMVYLGVIPIWLMAAIVVRDYAVGLIRDYAMLKYNAVIEASWFGKRKTEINALCAVLLLFFWHFQVAFEETKWIFYMLVVVANYLSLFVYLRDAVRSGSDRSGGQS